MQNWKMIALAPAFMVVAACGKDDSRIAADSALTRDLNLANQLRPSQLDSVSAVEAGSARVHAATTPSGTAAHRATTTRPRHTAATRSTSTAAHSTSSGSVPASSGGEVVVQKNTKRDAAIGAVAGAAIGAATSRDRVKGAVIGGVVGGVIGGVIGNNVDVKRTKRP